MITHKLSSVIAGCLALFLSGLALIALATIEEFVTVYQQTVFTTILIFMRVTGVIVLAYFGFNLWLSIEYRAIENERFKRDNQMLELSGEYEDQDDITQERLICEMFDNMKFTNSLSINEIAEKFFKAKGGKQSAKVKAILQKHGREV